MELRYLYEVDYRIPKEEGIIPEYRLLIRMGDNDHTALPFDIMNVGEYASLSLLSFFPRLDTQVVKELTPIQREKLHKASRGYSGSALGTNATKEYIIKNIFKTDPAMIDTLPELFHYLIKRHYAQETCPPGIDNYIVERLSHNDAFTDIPIRDIVTNRNELLRLLQDEWKKYLTHLEANLDHQDSARIEEFRNSLDDQFERWMCGKYSSIYSLSYLPQPKTLYRILPYLSSLLKEQERIALIVLDGMSYDQWSILSESFREDNEIEIQVTPVFAWVPTVTSISRQSLFSGRMPAGFSDSLYSTGKEEKLWTIYWQNEGIPKSQTGFFPNIRDQEIGEIHATPDCAFSCMFLYGASHNHAILTMNIFQ